MCKNCNTPEPAHRCGCGYNHQRTTHESNYRLDSPHGGTCRRAFNWRFFRELNTPQITGPRHFQNIATDDPPVGLQNVTRGQRVTTGKATIGGSFFPVFEPGKMLKPGVPLGASGKKL